MRIVVLLHERDGKAHETRYILWFLCERWRAEGHEVEVVRGLRPFPEPDLVIPHFDVTVVPEAYGRFLARYPRVLNRDVLDISKHAISRHLVREGDGWDGPVIVKTNLNCGGQPERRLFGRRRFGRRRIMDPAAYPIYDSLREVPARFRRNGDFVVERFLPQRDGDCYCMQIYSFFGDAWVNSRLWGTAPVVKAGRVVKREYVPVPDAIVAERRRLGFDYGKFDYVIHEGVPVLLDANRTPAFAGAIDAGRRERAERLATGLASV